MLKLTQIKRRIGNRLLKFHKLRLYFGDKAIKI